MLFERKAMKRSPKYLDLTRIRLPLPGFVSILHRASGLFLYLFMPFLLYLLQQSLASEQDFDALGNMLSAYPAKMALLFLLWAFLHHFCAGIRFLLLDIDVGIALGPARTSSKWVMIVSLFLTAFAGAMLW